jgi:hypothetical protein
VAFAPQWAILIRVLTICYSATVSNMSEFIIGILTHTPVWVWVLFIFLISRGIKARKPAIVTLEKLAIIPAIFLVWDIYDLVIYRQLTLTTVALWIAGIVAGAALGFMLIKSAAITRCRTAQYFPTGGLFGATVYDAGVSGEICAGCDERHFAANTATACHERIRHCLWWGVCGGVYRQIYPVHERFSRPRTRVRITATLSVQR